MPYRRIYFEKNQPFHIISRAVEERKIFEKEENCYRFIFQIFAANVGKPDFNLHRKDVIKVAQSLLFGEKVSSKFIIIEHSPLVSIFDFSLVVNHYHFYLMANIPNSIPLFIKKLNGGFAKYFNLKYNRKGTLFGSRYKSILVDTGFQSDAVSQYVGIINPLDVYQPGWREEGLKNWQRAFNFLESYQFSSFPDKTGKRKSKIIASQEVLEKYKIGLNLKKDEFHQFVEEFLKRKSV